ncbi:hypothetical protein [Robertkochia flava]|uniref:hypothetical protein n=1 Tax=Robertkochia flava TaxID=3447986 RepID=UPI001CD0375F|nr:hypothetical protein [Robertkochia marina]
MRTVCTTLMAALLLFGCSNDDDTPDMDSGDELPENLPAFSEDQFSDPLSITNIFYGPSEDDIYVYEGGEIGEEPEEEIRLERLNTTRVVNGVTCIIQNDKVYLDDILIEDTDDWLAQDDSGNLWYFGEEVDNYDEDGNFLDNDGAWEAGVDGALPGYWLPANPEVGQRYYQEYYEGEAEDEAEVIALNEEVTIGLGSYSNCLVTKDYTALEPGEYELKYYAPGVGLIMEEKFEDGELTERVELVEIIEQ